jgi:hypothetical protein
MKSPRRTWPFLDRLIFKMTAQDRICSTQQSESPDAAPAHAVWVELATRITTQPLHYRSGEEETAAESLHVLFGKVRDLIEKYPEAKVFCEIGLKLLNDTLRPYTARWHGWLTENKEKEAASTPKFRDELVRRMFRTELLQLQPFLLGYQKAFKALSEGLPVKSEWLTPDETATKEWASPSKHADLGKEPLKAGIGSQVAVRGDFTNAATTKEIDCEERSFIFKRRRILDPNFQPRDEATLDDAIGLALSGGGIRSATVCLGVVQVLTKEKLFAEIDYLSTVSGGGYFGSFLSSYLAPNQEGRSRFTKESIDNLLEDTFAPVNATTESAAIRHLRNNSKYLLHGGLWGKLKIAGLMASGLVTNLFMLLPLPLVAVLVIFGLNYLGFWGGAPCIQKALPISSLGTLAGQFLTYVFWVFLGSWIALPLARKMTLGQPPDSWQATLRGSWSAATLALALVTLPVWVIYALPLLFYGYAALGELRKRLGGPLAHILSENVLIAILGSLPFLFGAAAGLLKPQWIRNLLTQLFVLSGPFFYGWVILFVGAKMGMTTGFCEWQWWWVAGATLLWLLWSRFFVDINTLGPHGYYRDRLCECYLAYCGENKHTWWQAAIRRYWSGRKKGTVTSDPELQKIGVRLQLPLTKMACPGAAPYHLINTVVNLPASANRELRGRNGDFFILSPYFCGSPICGYVKTTLLEERDHHLDLGTAMAISSRRHQQIWDGGHFQIIVSSWRFSTFASATGFQTCVTLTK